ncbi:group II intron reverse transcriptase/maturase [Brevibacillus sp. NPDC058079]|uniref:group II intron reverse transcriptase/maturase n=1 Tax=Brevibacillus sp. NPDC058079 TaxID=3346330 RepID=UPI0036F025A9
MQKLNVPETEQELRNILDQLYESTKRAIVEKRKPKFLGLLEIISAEPTILTAIHNIKSNYGSKTAGSDGETMQEDILQKDYEEVILRVKQSLLHHVPCPVRRVEIPKASDPTKKRPLGIPAIIDRVVQECVRIVLDPICEAQFIAHSYGFRPQRDAHMAMSRLKNVLNTTGNTWVIEGDIKGFFDNVDHNVLKHKLWKMGVRDKRVLMIIQSMLKAGIMGQIQTNELGTPQGGIISPLLANVYLHGFDQWVVREWENKKTSHDYASPEKKYRALRNNGNFKQVYYIRYADDWVIVTDSEESAKKLKYKVQQYLKHTLKLDLSFEKTLITNVKKKMVKFLGFEIKRVPDKSAKGGYTTKTYADRERLHKKVKTLQKEISNMRSIPTKEYLIYEITRINQVVRGLIQYYKVATEIYNQMMKYQHSLAFTARRSLTRQGANPRFIPACETSNLLSVHSQYRMKIPTIDYEGLKIGVTNLSFCYHEYAQNKTQEETPYSEKGRELHLKRTGKKPLLVRADELFSTDIARLRTGKTAGTIYTFEYYLNRPYVFNRDKGKCRVCNREPSSNLIHIHHKNPRLPAKLVNKVLNLVTTCMECHNAIHNDEDYSHLSKKTWDNIRKYREIFKNGKMPKNQSRKYPVRKTKKVG